MSKSSFNPRDYMLVFEEAIKDKEFRQVFLDYLRHRQSHEPILFLNAFDAYCELYEKTVQDLGGKSPTQASTLPDDVFDQQQSPQLARSRSVNMMRKKISLLYREVKKIMDEFVKIGAEKELNMGSAQGTTLELWKLVQQQFEMASSFSSSSDKMVSSPNTPTVVTNDTTADDVSVSSQSELVPFHELLQELNPKVMLENVHLGVNIDLKMDQFPRFVRSDAAYEFMRKKGEEYTRFIAINVTRGFSVDMRFKPEDLNGMVISDQHIYFGFTLLEDTPDWELFYSKEDIQCFMSKTSFVFDKNNLKGMKLTKLVMTLPYSLEDVWAMWIHHEYQVELDPKANKLHTVLDFIIPKLQDAKDEKMVYHPPYAISYCSMEIEVVKFMKTRFCPHIFTSFYDPVLSAYVIVSRSVNDDEEKMLHPERIYPPVLSYYYFIRVNEKETRIAHFLYSDFKVNMMNDLVVKTFWKGRSKGMRKGMMSILDRVTEKKTKSLNISDSDDKLHNNKMVNIHSGMYEKRSWYDEWTKLQKK